MEEKRKLRWKWIAPVLVVALVFAVWNIAAILRRERVPAIDITAPMADATHIPLDSIFTIRGAGDMDPDELAGRLTITPEREFRLTGGDDGALALQTYLPLEAGQQVVIRLQDRGGKEQKRWEFRTLDTFHVVSVFPTDGATDVFTGTSAEIALSYADYDIDQVEKYITVNPDCKVSFSQNFGAIVVAAWEREFPAMTPITVTVSADLPRKNGDTLGQDYQFTFTTGAEGGRAYYFSSWERVTENILPGDDVLLQLELGDNIKELSLSTIIYRYPDSAGYVRALGSYRDAIIAVAYSADPYMRRFGDRWTAEVEGLDEVVQFSAPAVSLDDYGNQRSVLVPQSLDPGWYVAQVTAELPSGTSATLSKLIQVNPLSVYYAQSHALDTGNTSQVVAWINDTVTGKTIGGARVGINAKNFKVSGKTGSDGVAILDGKMDFVQRDTTVYERGQQSYTSSVGILSVVDGSKEFYDIYGDGNGYGESFREKNPENDFTTYLFTDRPVYRHTDTIKVWGVVKPRREGIATPPGLHLSMGDHTVTQPVTLNADGTFQTEFSIDSLSGNYGVIQLLDENWREYEYLYVDIRDFVKPVYRTTSSLEKPIYTGWEDEEVAIDFTAAYFEGTPAPDYKAVARFPGDYDYEPFAFAEASLTTDGEGKAQVTIKPEEIPREKNKYSSGNKWEPQKIFYGIYSDAELGVPQVEGGSFYYLFRDTMLTLEKGEDGTSFTAKVNRIDASRIKTAEDISDAEKLRGAPVDTSLRIEVHKEYYQQTPNGEWYDAINKTSVTAYEDEWRDDVVKTFSQECTGGRATITGLPADDPLASYYVQVSIDDSRGMEVTDTLQYRLANQIRRGGNQHWFNLTKRGEPEEHSKSAMGYYGELFRDGETLDFYLTDSRETYDPQEVTQEYDHPDGRLLALVAQDTVLTHKVVQGAEFQLPYDERYLPDYRLFGAYFDGKRVYALSSTILCYSPEQRELAIDIQPGQERYDPGASADVRFKVTEKSSGAPAANAKLVAAVVDEAIFAIQEQKPDFLNRLYKSIDFSHFLQYTSYDNHNVDGGGMGAGGPDPFIPRVKFQDTAAFTVLTTDAEGAASLRVPLPDNLTSWRVTALALTDTLRAGDTKNNFSVSKDFFVNPVVPARLLEGDDLVVTANSAGEKTTPDTAVVYTCSIEGRDGVITVQAKAGDFTPMELSGLPSGKLPLGDYRITVTGESEAGSDAVTLPLSVVESGIEISVNTQLSLKEAAALQSTTYPVVLGFYDQDNALSAEILGHLSSYSGSRVDQRMARRFVQERMQAWGADSAALDRSALDDNFRQFYPEYTYLQLFPYSQPDAVLSARARLTVPEEYYSAGTIFEPEELPGITDPATRAAAYVMVSDYYGDKAMIDAITAELDSSIYSFRDRMYLVAALARAGDKDGAASAYTRLTADNHQEQTDTHGNKLLSIPRSDGLSGDTAAACIAATLLELPDAEALVRQLLLAESTEDPYLFELMYFLQQQRPASSGSAGLTYTLDGKQQTLDLTDGPVYRSFSREQLNAAGFAPTGNIWANARYTVDLEQALARKNDSLQVGKTIGAVEGGVLRQGGLARITLTFHTPAGIYLDPQNSLAMEDYLPSGMRYEYMAPNTGWYLTAQNDQRISFGSSVEDAKTLVFYARCVAPGEYLGERAFISTGTGSIWGASQRQTVTIQ